MESQKLKVQTASETTDDNENVVRWTHDAGDKFGAVDGELVVKILSFSNA